LAVKKKKEEIIKISSDIVKNLAHEIEDLIKVKKQKKQIDLIR